MRTLTALLLAPALLLGAFARPAAADNAPPPADSPTAQACKDNPRRCEQLKRRREAYCKNNPQTCEARRQARQDRKKWCAENQAKCQKLKDERQQRQEQRKDEAKPPQ